MVKWHFIEILASIQRRITLKRKFKDPFTCVVYRDIHKNIFYQAFRAIRDYPIQFGTFTEVLRNKKNVIIGYSIKFEHLGAFKFHLKQLADEDTSNSLSKKFTTGSSAAVVVTPEKPATLNYKVSNSSLTIRVQYEIKNKYGVMTSY